MPYTIFLVESSEFCFVHCVVYRIFRRVFCPVRGVICRARRPCLGLVSIDIGSYLIPMCCAVFRAGHDKFCPMPGAIILRVRRYVSMMRSSIFLFVCSNLCFVSGTIDGMARQDLCLVRTMIRGVITLSVYGYISIGHGALSHERTRPRRVGETDQPEGMNRRPTEPQFQVPGS